MLCCSICGIIVYVNIIFFNFILLSHVITSARKKLYSFSFIYFSSERRSNPANNPPKFLVPTVPAPRRLQLEGSTPAFRLQPLVPGAGVGPAVKKPLLELPFGDDISIPFFHLRVEEVKAEDIMTEVISLK